MKISENLNLLGGDFFLSYGPPGHADEVVRTSSFIRAVHHLQLDAERRRGDIKIITGTRGVGKSTCLDYLNRQMLSRGFPSTVFDVGLHIPKMLAQSPNDAVRIFFEELARRLSNEKSSKIEEVVAKFSESKSVYFVFIDNLDRFHRDQSDLNLVRFLFQVGDPTFKALSKQLVMTFAAAPEWAEILSSPDLSYLNYPNRVELQSVSAKELTEFVSARMEQRQLRIEEFFSRDFMNALWVTSGGNPRTAFQILQRFVSRDDDETLPLGIDAFQRVIPEDLFKAANDRLRSIAQESSDLSWGVNQLARYFDALEKGGIEADRGIRALLQIFAKNKISADEIPAAAAWRIVAHRSDPGSPWLLNDPVRSLLSAWGKIGIARDILLTAFSQTPFRVSTTDVQERAHDFQQSLAFDSWVAEQFGESLSEYSQLQLAAPSQSNRRTLVQTCWSANMRLMFSITVLATRARDEALHHDLGSPERFNGAAVTLIERVNAIYKKTGKENPYRADLLQLKELYLDLSVRPGVVAHWEDHQIANMRVSAIRAYEGILRNLNPRVLRKLSESYKEKTARLAGVVSQGDTETTAVFPHVWWNPERGERDELGETRLVQTVAAFMNSHGGSIVVGAVGGAEPHGVAADRRLLPDQTQDGMERQILLALEQRIGSDATHAVEVGFAEIGKVEICELRVRPMPAPVFIWYPASRKEFWIRRSGKNLQLAGPDYEAYCLGRWKRSFAPGEPLGRRRR